MPCIYFLPSDELVQVLDVKSPPSGQRASGSVFVKGLDSGTVYQITMVALSSSGTSTSSKKKVASTSLTRESVRRDGHHDDVMSTSPRSFPVDRMTRV